jgi:sugar lactone lactonase YvrE
MSSRARAVLGCAIAATLCATTASAAPPYRVLGQPTLADNTLASRCADAAARFNYSNAGGFDMYGPSGIAIDPRGRIFVTDFGGQRVLTWPDFDALASCQPADAVIGAGELSGPEAVAYDVRGSRLYVSDTLSHTVRGYRRNADGTWSLVMTLGTAGVSGNATNQFFFPRGLAVDQDGRLFVADDYNHRVLIFNSLPWTGASAVDSIGASSNGGFQNPKGLAMVGHVLFVADYSKNRVLRFTGPFDTPSLVYVATGTFTGVTNPVDVAFGGDGSLFVTDQGNQRVAVYVDAAWRTSLAAPSRVFAENLGPEPLGVAVDRAGRVYMADYTRYRVLVRDEKTRTAPVSAGYSAAASALLANLHARPTLAADRVASGQQLISYLYGPRTDPAAWYGDWLQMEAGAWPLPEIMGAELSDLMSYPGFAPNQDALDELLAHGQAGHMVTLVWHPDNPTLGAFGTPISTANMTYMYNDATVVGQRWQVQLDRAAAVLQQFEDAGVPVLFRPLHEQNGDFFWWGHNGAKGAALRTRQAAYVTMWRDMVTELTTRKGLTNVLFVFGTNQVNYGAVAPPMTYYPGGTKTDVVSIDVYDDLLDLAGSNRGYQHYAALIASGKPFGLAEVGQAFGGGGTSLDGAWDARTVVRRVRDSFPRTVFAIHWYTSGEPPNDFVFALPDVSYGKTLLQDVLVDTQ